MNVNHTCKKSSELKNIIKTNKIVVLKLSAEWCGPCKSIAPIFNQTSKNVKFNIDKLPSHIPKPSIHFLSIDIDHICQDKGLKWGEHFQCTGVPMFIFFYNGKTYDTIVGGDMNAVNNLIENLIQESLP